MLQAGPAASFRQEEEEGYRLGGVDAFALGVEAAVLRTEIVKRCLGRNEEQLLFK